MSTLFPITTGAVCGQLAGAFYGEREMLEAWRSKPTHRQPIENVADSLLKLSSGI